MEHKQTKKKLPEKKQRNGRRRAPARGDHSLLEECINAELILNFSCFAFIQAGALINTGYRRPRAMPSSPRMLVRPEDSDQYRIRKS